MDKSSQKKLCLLAAVLTFSSTGYASESEEDTPKQAKRSALQEGPQSPDSDELHRRLDERNRRRHSAAGLSGSGPTVFGSIEQTLTVTISGMEYQLSSKTIYKVRHLDGTKRRLTGDEIVSMELHNHEGWEFLGEAK